MLNRTGAAPIAAGDLSPAMAKTDMAMPTQSGATKSLIPGFAQVLESSIETAGHAGGLHTPKFAIATKARNAPPSEPAPTSINLVPTQSQQPAVPTRTEIAYTLSPAVIAALVPVGANDSETSSDPTGETDPTSVATVASSTDGIFESRGSDLVSMQLCTPGLSASDTATSNTFSSLPLISANNIQSSLGGAPAPAELTRTAQSPWTPTTSKPSISSEDADSNGFAAAQFVSNTTETFVPPAPVQQLMPTQQDLIGQVAPPSTAGTATSGTNGAQAKASEITFSAPDARFPSLQFPQAEISDSYLASATTQTQKQTPTTSSSSVPLSSSQDPQIITLNSPLTTDVTQGQQQTPSVDLTSDSTPSDDSATQDSQTDTAFASSAMPSSDQAVNDSSVSAQSPSDTTAAGTVPAVTLPSIADTSSKTAPIANTWSRKGAELTVTSFSSSVNDRSKSNNTQTVSAGSGWTVSAPQTPEATIATSYVESSARQQKFPAGNLSGKAKSDVPNTTSAAAPRPVVAADAPASASSKIQDAAAPTPLNTSPLSDSVWNIPTPPGNTTVVTSLKLDGVNISVEESAAPNLADKTSLDSSAAFDQSANSGTDDNSRPTISQTNTATVSSALFAPVSVASNPSASAQTVSLASALKLDSSSPPTGSNSINRGDAGGDTQLPSAVVVHRAAEAAEMSAGLQAWNGGDNAQTRMVQSARLAGNLGASEMNVSLRADTLGAVELRTHVTGDLVGASISVERHDAHAMLSNDLGTLHQALNDRQLRVGDVKVFQGAFGSDATAADSQSSPRREMGPQQQQSTNWTSGPALSSAAMATTADRSDSKMLFDSNGRLSVRA